MGMVSICGSSCEMSNSRCFKRAELAAFIACTHESSELRRFEGQMHLSLGRLYPSMSCFLEPLPSSVQAS